MESRYRARVNISFLLSLPGMHIAIKLLFECFFVDLELEFGVFLGILDCCIAVIELIQMLDNAVFLEM